MNEGIKKVVPHRDSILRLQYSSLPVGLPEAIFYSTNYFSSSFNYKFKAILFTYVKIKQCFYIAIEN